MFETLFLYATVVDRHRSGPLAVERAAYLEQLSAQGYARNTILRRAGYCLWIASELHRRKPAQRCFDQADVDELAKRWAAECVAAGRASGTRWPAEHVRLAASDFLGFLGLTRSPAPTDPGRYDREFESYMASQHAGGRWLSEATFRAARWHVTKFLDHLAERDVALDDVSAEHVDVFFQHVGQRWSRSSLQSSAKMLRSWFLYCESQRWVSAGIADSILSPRIYRHEAVPLGPTWEQVRRMLAEARGEEPQQLRDYAILLLLSVYALRSGEVRRLQTEDVDWSRDRLHVIRSKSGRREELPLEPGVGNAIARYLRYGRPQSDGSVIFLRLRAPHRPLTQSGLYHVVERYLSKVASPRCGRGPHGLRHACARHLIEAGRSIKEVGDHLGHRSPGSTGVYAKVALSSLRRVAFDDLGGLR